METELVNILIKAFMKKVLYILLLFLSSGTAWAKLDTLRISVNYTTHVIFSSDITYADLSNNKVVAGKIIEQNKNMLALKAREAFTGSCSVSALESNGTMHTFIIVYEEHPRELVIDVRPKEMVKTYSSNSASGAAYPTEGANYVSETARLIAEQRERLSAVTGKPYTPPKTQVDEGRVRSNVSSQSVRSSSSGGNVSMWKSGSAPLLQDVVKQPQRLYHISCKEYDIQVLCEDISSYSDITYIVLSLRNGSGISYDIGDATFVIESAGSRKRTVKYDKTVFPRNRQGKLSAAPGEYTRAAYSFDKLTLSKDQVLRIYLYENEGQRNMVLTLKAKDINKARMNI